MTTNNPDDSSAAASVRERQITIMTQLLKAVTMMHSIDELFQWLCYAIVQQFNLELTQFWTPMMNESGALSTHVRMMVARDPSLPKQLLLNDQIIAVARRITFEQRATIAPQPVDSLFSPHQASLLHRYNFKYCIGGFVNSNVLLPAPHTSSSMREPALFALTHLHFLLQPPHRDLMPTINAILKQAIDLAVNRRLLMPVASYDLPVLRDFASLQGIGPETPLPSVRDIVPPLAKLVPRRKESADIMLSSNPFARAAVIPDKLARRLHGAIDGEMTVADLSQSMGMTMDVVAGGLKLLLHLNRIEFYNAQGNLVNPELIFQGL
jgi:hypothetical protein